jgi:hypothetical protein
MVARQTAILFLSLVGAASPALAETTKTAITITVTGGTPTGYPRAMIEGLNAVVREAYPGSAVTFKPNSPGGGVVAISEGEADLTATATGAEIKLANLGAAPFRKSYKGKFLYVMMLFDTQYMHYVMTKSWAEANGIRTWCDIAAKKPRMRLAINRPDNPQTTIGGVYEVMKVHGFTVDDIVKWGGSYVLGNSTLGLDALADGKADVFLHTRNLGDPALKDLTSKRELIWIDGDPGKIRSAAAVFGFQMDLVRKDTYPFLDKDFPTVRMALSMLAGAHVPEDIVYKYVKAVAESEERVRKIGGSLRSFKVGEMPKNPADLAFHPGALRYYKERGWLNP